MAELAGVIRSPRNDAWRKAAGRKLAIHPARIAGPVHIKPSATPASLTVGGVMSTTSARRCSIS